MKLEGSLDAFSLPDIFQLLSFTKKSGGLHLASDGCDGVVFFAGGQVTGASADGSRQPLARRLIGAGVVDDDALAAAVQASTSGESLGVVKALLEHGAIDGGLLRQAVSDQSVDAVFDLLRWQEGDFAFVVEEVNPDDVGVALTIEAILSDAESRSSNWEAVSAVVPSASSLLSMPVVLPADPQISREEWSLLALVDGRRSVAELVDLTGSGHYAVVSTLAGMITRGLLEVRDATDTDDDHVGVVVRRQGLLAALEGSPFQPVRTSAPVNGAGAKVEVAAVSEPEKAPDVGSANGPDANDASDSAAHMDVSTAEGAGDDAATPDGDPGLVTVASAGAPMTLVGTHVPGDVVPPRSEPFLPKRQAEFDEPSPSPETRPMQVRSSGPGIGGVIGANAVALDPEAVAMIERDPNVNRSLMLRLIAGVRGL
jgi:hypothetical protein